MFSLVSLAWIIASLIIAICGTKLRFGFWGYFFASLLLSPVMGLLLLAAALPPRQKKA